MTIPRHSSVALIGPTGCGKTTLVDLLLGLLKPQSGKITVDGRNIEENLPSWQKKIGYVPQFIYLLDDSIRENVAFGVLPEEIDDNRVWQVLEQAQIADFVRSLPGQLAEPMGELGSRLSGGQRQRIGIARALYAAPEILILDEATSALDLETERAFADALAKLKGALTILTIAHRPATVQMCDRVVRLVPAAGSSSARNETDVSGNTRE